jgi:hypothetical protein
MSIPTLRLIVAVTAGITLSSGQEAFDFDAEHVRILRNKRGTLHVDVHGVIFRSDDPNSDIQIPLERLRHVDVSNPKALHFETFDVEKWRPVKRREYTFRASADTAVGELARFFAAHIPRPVIGYYAEENMYRIPAYHRRRLDGTHGTLEIGPQSIQYLSEARSDSRTWLYRDIETIGRPDALQLRVTAGKETYVLELQERMPPAAYDLIWEKIYGPAER